MKQAVVLIHGIGEQKPMQTLRSFVGALLGPGEEGKEPFFSKPDPMSELMELRRLQSAGRPTTHFYEYYWAYNAEGTKLIDVLSWLWQLLARSWRNVPASARGLWLTAWLLTLGLLIAIWQLPLGHLRTWFKAEADALSLTWLALLTAGLVLNAVAVSYLGDAARYMSPKPSNIRLRRAIRAEGIKLLRALHDGGEYDRIIVVGHSLGSVIGYDLISYLWQEYHDRYPALADPAFQAFVRDTMSRNESPQPVIRDQLSTIGESLQPGSAEDVARFQAVQLEGWRELRRYGNPWRISDFVTLGSPLAHGMMLMATSREDFDERKRQRELPTCPPTRDTKGYAYSSPTPVDIGDGQKFTPLVLHHAAPFAVTRWTNLFFPARCGLFGDIVGGPLQSAFGAGIRDVPVSTNALANLAGWTPLSHTRYWRGADLEPTSGTRSEARRPALAAVRQALRLSYLRDFSQRSRDGARSVPKEATPISAREQDEPTEGGS